MSSVPENAERQQQKIGEFLRLLPLTLELAGLPRSEPGATHYNEGQLEARAAAVRAAYKQARQLVLEVTSS